MSKTLHLAQYAIFRQYVLTLFDSSLAGIALSLPMASQFPSMFKSLLRCTISTQIDWTEAKSMVPTETKMNVVLSRCLLGGSVHVGTCRRVGVGFWGPSKSPSVLHVLWCRKVLNIVDIIKVCSQSC